MLQLFARNTSVLTDLEWQLSTD